MCWLVRCTVRRTASWRWMRTRVLAARRCRETFFCMVMFVFLAPLLLLGLFDDDLLVGVANALALVRLGGLVRAHLGGNLAHPLAVHALDQDLGLRRRLGLDAFRERIRDRMREAEAQVQLVALGLG